MKLKPLLTSFIVTIFICLGINALGENLEGFWFEQELVKKPELFTASLSKKIIEIQLEQFKSDKELRSRFEDLDINAKAVISVKIDREGNEKILFEKNPEQTLAIASLTKLMTALVVFDLDETYSFFDLISITKESVDQEGSSKYRDLKVEERLSVENLLHIMLIESSNDAAFALTSVVGDETFVGLMNLYAKDIGLENTHFVNPTGLEQNYSNAQDLVKLAKHILSQHPRIFEFTAKQSRTILNENGSVHHFIPENTNKLLAEIPEIIGGKTGWTPEAGDCLLIVLDDPNSNDYYINVVLGAKDRFAEMRKLINTIQNY